MQKGFTLIELLVVLVIISIVTAVTITGLNRHEESRVEAFAKRVEQAIMAAKEQALLQPTVIGMVFNDHSYDFVELHHMSGSSKTIWEPIEDTLLRTQTVPDQVAVWLDAKLKTKPQLVVATNGDMTPFKIYVSEKAHKPSFVISADVNGKVTLEKLKA